MNLLRFGYHVILATFAPRYVQKLHDIEFHEHKRVAQTVVDTLWLLGVDSRYLELRDAECCTVCNRATWVWFAGDQQCAPCMRAWLDKSFAASKKRKK